jgi:hypothetical protein
MHLNLLPFAERRRLLVRKRIHQWLPMTFLATLIGVIACSREYSMLGAERETLARVESRTEAALERVEQVERIRQRLDALQQRESLVAMQNNSGQPLQLVGMVSQGANQSKSEISIENFTLSTIQERVTVPSEIDPARTATQVNEVYELKLQATAASDLAVTRFVAALKDYNVFDRVLLESSRAISDDDGRRKFNLSCRYE